MSEGILQKDIVCDGLITDQMLLNDALNDRGHRAVVPDTVWIN